MKTTNLIRSALIFSMSLFSLTLLSAIVLASTSVSADSVVDDVSVMVAESCTLSTPSGAGQVYVVDMQNGQYKNDIGKTRISVFCNTGDSFAVYAIGYSDDTFGNTNMITTSTGATNIATGTATSGDTSNWSFVHTFNTQCGIIDTLPFTQNFDGWGSGSGARPACWSCGGYSNYPYIMNVTDDSGMVVGHTLYLYSYGSNQVYAMLPQLDSVSYPSHIVQISIGKSHSMYYYHSWVKSSQLGR